MTGRSLGQHGWPAQAAEPEARNLAIELPLSAETGHPGWPTLIGLDGLPQSDDSDLAAAVEAQRNVADTKTSIGVANHVSRSPQSDAFVPAAQQMGDYRSAAGQAYLSTMGVATKVESIPHR